MSQQRVLRDLGGRTTEVAVLSKAFAHAANGSGGAVLIEGDAGIGKSWLLERLRKTVAAEGGRFARGACYPYLRTPYTPIREAIRSLGEIELPLRTAKYEAFTATVQALARFAIRAPLVVAIDDLQWADRATLELVDFIVDHIADKRVLFVCTRRTEPIEQAKGIDAALARIAQTGALRIHLGPLQFDDVQTIIHPEAARMFTAETLRRIVERAEGNPLFIEEMVAQLMSGADITGCVLPSSLRAQVSERLSRLTNGERNVLAMAAIIGGECDLDDLLATMDVPPARRIVLVDKVLRTGLLVHASELRLAFRHSLLREAVYESLSLRERRLGHDVIARRLEARLEPQAQIAFHYMSSGDEARAALWYERAGNEALQVFAYADAAQFFRRACQIADVADRARLRENAAEALLVDGDVDAARREYALAADLYGSSERPEERLRTLAKLISAMSVDAEYQEGKSVARKAIREARHLGNSNLSCNILATAADNARIAGRLTRARILLHHASMSVMGASGETLARFHDVAAKTAAGELRNDDARLHFEAATRHAESIGNTALVIRVLSNAADIVQRVGAYDEAVARWRHILDLAREREFGWRIPFGELGLADLLLMRGDVAQAESLVDDAISRGLGCEALRFLAAGVGIRLGLMIGREDLIRSCSEPSTLELALRIRDSASLSRVAAAFIELALARGDESRARDIARAYADRRTGAVLSERALPYLGRFGSDAEVALADGLLVNLPAHRSLLRAYDAKRRGAETEAHRLAKEAADQFAGLRLVGLHLEAEAVGGDRVQYSGTRSARRSANALSALTPREREICAEVAHGDSNREIATRLGISVKTVSHHLESIYARLGLEGRARLVAHLNSEKHPAA